MAAIMPFRKRRRWSQLRPGLTEAAANAFMDTVAAEAVLIDPDTCETTHLWRSDIDSYNLLSEEAHEESGCHCRRLFVRRRPGSLWVRDIDLPDDAFKRLQARIDRERGAAFLADGARHG
jgi:hypothetical protein